VEQQEQSRWRLTRRQLLWAGGIAALAFLIIVVCGYFFGWKWTGLVKDPKFPMRTLWDWMQLLIIPAVLAGGGLWFNSQQREREQQIADVRAQDEALQAYLDQISQLLTDKDRPLNKAQPSDTLSTVARARTLTALWRLDGSRKGSLVQFLYESDLITKHSTVIDLSGAHLVAAHLWQYNLRETNLSGANLSNAILRDANLNGANLNGANLNGANLSYATLSEADLSYATLSEANLNWANLSNADLSNADLSEADLSNVKLGGANLSNTNLSGVSLRDAKLGYAALIRATLSNADLRGAELLHANLNGADLSGADLRDANMRHAREVTNEQLEQQARSLEGATMSEGTKHP